MSCGVYAVCHFKCICHGRQKSYKKNSVGVKRVGEKKETAIRVICPGIGLQCDFDSLKRTTRKSHLFFNRLHWLCCGFSSGFAMALNKYFRIF